MKCPICNAENGADASSCHQCGFSLSLGQAAWPDFPTIEMPDPLEIEFQPPPPETAPIDDTPKEAIRQTAPPKIESVEDAIEIVAAKAPPSEQPSDDELAREHIARGFEAIRQSMPDQARWELEQAHDLADSEDIAHMAQSQLDELASAAAPIVPSRPAPIASRRPPSSIELPPSAALVRTATANWVSTMRISMIAGVVNGMLASWGTVSCFGFLLSLFVSFVAGVLIAQQAAKNNQRINSAHAIVAGVVTGLGGWLGQAAGYSAWLTSLSNAQTDLTAAWPLVACLSGVFYIPLSAAVSIQGWKMGTPKQK